MNRLTSSTLRSPLRAIAVRFFVITFLATMSALSEPASAATLYWDNDGNAAGNNAGTGAGLGGTGTWDTTSIKWWDGVSGADQAWANGNDAVVKGTGGTLTLGAPIQATTITMGTTAFTFTPTAGNTLEFNSLTVPTTGGIQTTLQGGLAGALAGPDDLTIISNNGAGVANNVAIGVVQPNTFTGNVNLNGSGAGTTSASRLAFLINTIGSVPATADFNYGRSMSQVVFNVAGNHGTVAHDFNLNTGNIANFEGWIGALATPVNLSGVISGNSILTFGLGLSGGAGIITLSNNNTYTGDTKLLNAQTGVIKLGVDNAFPTTTGIIMATGSTNAGSIDLNGKNQTIASLASNTTGIENGIANTAGASATSILTINGSATTSYDGPLGSVVNAANMPGAAADLANLKLVLHASNTGQLTLTGPTGGGVAYSGGTEINGGTLIVANTSGSGTGTGPVMVGGGTLAGTGSVAGSVTVNSGTLAPGTSIGAIGMGGALSMTGGTYNYEFNSSLLTGDLTNVGGALNIDLGGAAQLSLTDGLDAALALGTKFTLISYLGAWNGGEFDGYGDDTGFNIGSNRFKINYDDTPAGAVNGGGHPNAVTMVVIPEPASLALWALGCTLVLGTRRRGA